MSESQVEPAGNTNPAGEPVQKGRKPQSVQLYRWAFTLKADESQESQETLIWNVLHPICKEFLFQLERGEGGYLHYQGCLTLNVKHRIHELKNMLGWNTIHLEGCRNWFASKKYCTKDEGRVKGPWSESMRPIKPKLNGPLRPWQQGLVDYINGEVDDRKIRVYYDPVGRAGKSSIGIHLYDTRKDVLWVPPGKYEGVKETVIRKVVAGETRAVIFGMPRNLVHSIPWDLMEELKDGCALNTRYSTLLARFNPVHVIVMTNWIPSEEGRKNLLTYDRWDVITLS